MLEFLYSSVGMVINIITVKYDLLCNEDAINISQISNYILYHVPKSDSATSTSGNMSKNVGVYIVNSQKKYGRKTQGTRAH
jgi:hypothetical protein